MAAGEASSQFLLGVNYWPRKQNTRMWESWSPSDVAEDLELARQLGVRLVRAFIRDLDFADEDGSVRPQALSRLREFLDIAHAKGVRVLMTLLVGHMSGKNWRIPWTSNEELYSPASVSRTCRFVEQVVSAARGHPALLGWILSNELSLVRRAANREEALNMLRACYLTVKRLDPGSLFSSGDVPDSFMQETPNVRGLVDYVGPHLYLYDSDPVRHGLTYGALIEIFRDMDFPVLLEEFGFSSHQFSEGSRAAFIKEVLYTALAHGAIGALAWCLSDFSAEGEAPYDWRPLELGFGLISADGRPKESAEAFRSFASELAKVELAGLHFKYSRSPVGVVISPFYLFSDYEFVWYRQALGFWGLARVLATSIAMASTVGLNPVSVYEGELTKALRARAIIMPSTVAALASTWRRLLNYVEDGGTLIVSLMRGIGGFRAYHESATHLWRELFGVSPAMEAGAEGLAVRGRLTLRSGLRELDGLTTDVPVEALGYKVSPVDAEVIAESDELRAPLVLRARRGRGLAYLITVPLEAIVAHQGEADWRLSALYGALARDAGLELMYPVNVPGVESVTYTSQDSDLVFIVNHSLRAARFELLPPRGRSRLEKVAGEGDVSGHEVAVPAKSGLIIRVS